MNIVTESKEYQKNSSINDCLKPDPITENLWIWAERLERLGKRLFWIIIIFGFFIALSTAIITEDVYKDYTETTFSFSIFVTSVLQTALYAFIEYCVYHVLALLIGALANITQNTKTTARLTEYVARKTLKENESDNDEMSFLNQNETQTQPDIQAQTDNYIEEDNSGNPPISAKIINDEKVCPICGQAQRLDREICWSCGQKFDN